MITPEPISGLLKQIDAAGAPFERRDEIPLEVWGQLLLQRPVEYPNLVRRLPQMPADEVQINWTGSTGETLMRQSVVFVRTLTYKYAEFSTKELANSQVLDFGCGWGRLLRLLARSVPSESLYGCDPWEKSIELCRQHHVPARVAQSEYLPQELPWRDQSFDLIYAFSVFTHLSERSFRTSLHALTQALRPGGILAVTIRPCDYWNVHDFSFHDFSESERAVAIRDHRDRGFVFYPHKREAIDGDVTYGDTSISITRLTSLASSLEYLGLEWNSEDPFQVLVFFRKA